MTESSQQSAFISIYHKRVPVTAEMKIELHRMNSTLRAKMRKERRCAQKDFLQCCGDCLSCYWRRNGIYVSLDSLLDNGESQDDDEADKTMRRIDCRFVNHFGHDRKQAFVSEKPTSKDA